MVSATAFVILVAVWWVGASAINIPALFPTPPDVWREFGKLLGNGQLLEHIEVSLARIGAGFMIGSLLAIPLGLLMGNVKIIRDFIEAYVEFFRYIPALSLVTLAMIWFGIGETAKVFLIVYSTVFIVTVNTTAGIVAVPLNKIRAARSLGANEFQMLFYLTLPAAVPFILTGMRIALGNAYAVIVAAEMVAAQSGLGFLIFSSRLYMQTDAIFVGIIALGLLGFATDRLMRFLIVTFARRYAPQL
jgi:NitT/TauT family transport system permease protein